jgi:membrane-associated phospholipid phosphatase
VWLGLAAVVAAARRRPGILVETLAAVVLAELSTDLLKLAIPRARPDVHALVARPHTHSFPSGHAAIAFACATVLGAAVPRARPWLYVLAALVAWSRVYVGVHFPLDVAAGALLGVGLGLAVLRARRTLGAARRRSRRAPPAG